MKKAQKTKLKELILECEGAERMRRELKLAPPGDALGNVAKRLRAIFKDEDLGLGEEART